MARAKLVSICVLLFHLSLNQVVRLLPAEQAPAKTLATNFPNTWRRQLAPVARGRREKQVLLAHWLAWAKLLEQFVCLSARNPLSVDLSEGTQGNLYTSSMWSNARAR